MRLSPHPESCDLAGVRERATACNGPLAVDLFCGAGGMSLGLAEAGFNVLLGVDSDPVCVETHRAWFAGCSLCADLCDPHSLDRIEAALRGHTIDLLAAGPPCQPYSRAGRSKFRSLGRKGPTSAEESEMWAAVASLVRRIRPRAVLIENVPGLTEQEDIRVVASMTEALETLGYDCYARSLAARDYGVPQHRERIFIVAIERGVPFHWPRPQGHVTLRDAISDLPPVEAGVYREWVPYEGPRTAFQAAARCGVPPDQMCRVYDHYTRAVREDDLAAFRLMDCNTKYSDLPACLRRYRADIFEDKYKRLSWDAVARTITAHLAKDGYWYIHPEQHRTLTVREAARIQTFPDWFRFAGTPTQAFRQIGNAVPPRLARAIGLAVLNALNNKERKDTLRPCYMLRRELVQWFDGLAEQEMCGPWRKASSRWQVLLGMILLERAPLRLIADFWPTFRHRWPSPARYLADPLRHAAIRALGKAAVIECLDAIAQHLTRTAPAQPEASEHVVSLTGIPVEKLRLALILAGKLQSLELTPAVSRVVRRLFGDSTPLTRINDRLAIARLAGRTAFSKVLGALLELADRFCHTGTAHCDLCSMRALCATARCSSRREGVP